MSMKLLFLMGSFVLGALGANPHLGTWKIDVEKSKYETHPAPKSETVTVTADAKNYRLAFDIVTADGQPISGLMTFPIKGGAAEVTGFPTDPDSDHVVAKVASDKKWVFLHYRKDDTLAATLTVTTDGKVTKATVSVNGKVVEEEIAERQ